ncbi:MAG: carboxypeptidase regulatory-like domain-containing protein [Acidobacteriota bacterium]
MKKSKCIHKVLLALVVALLACGTGWSQAVGSIVGSVTDTSGAVIPGAKVTVTNVATNVTNVTQSDASGNFQVLNLLPGNYKVVVQKQGFQQYVIPSEAVAVDKASPALAKLSVGQVSQTVEISSQAPLLNTQSSSLSYGVESKQVEQLPLNGRNVLNLTQLVPGVVPQGGTQGNPATNNITGLGNYQIGGGIANQSAFYVDGAPINVSYVNGAELIPTQEDVDSFQVETNDVSPEYGRFAGGIVNIATKSGANQFHGTLYEYARNAALNANSWFNNHDHLPRAVWTQNQYGATVGGPIIKDKAFFFLSWEQFDLQQQNTTNDYVPNPAWLAGDFSSLLNHTKNGQPAPIHLSGPYDPNTDKIINPADLNSTAQVLAPLLWPGPKGVNAVRSPDMGTNFTIVWPKTTDYNQYNVRGDQNLGSRQKLFERFTLWHINSSANNFLQNNTGTHGWHSTDQAVVGDTITLKSNLVADVRASFLRFHNVTLPLSCCTFNEGSLGGNWGAYQTQMTFPELPQPTVTGLHNFGPIPTILDTDNAYVLSGNLTQILGRHTLTYGAEGRKIEWDYVQSNSSGGFLAFSGDQTGYGFADFMVGQSDKSSAQEPVLSKGVMWYYGAYMNDAFRWTPKLTINAGLRWEQPGSFTETHGSLTTLIPTLPQPAISNAVGRPVTGGLALINSPQYPHKTWQQLHWALFSPRVGINYSPTATMTFSSGFGISYLPPTVAFSLGPYNAPTNLSTTTQLNPSLSDPFPTGITPPPGRSQSYIDGLIGQGIQSPISNQTYPYQMQWNLGVQKQLGNSAMIQVAYVGARGNHLPLYSVNIDQLPDQYDVCGYDSTQPQCNGHLLNDQVSNPMFGVVPAKSGPALAGPTIRYGMLLKPNPAYQYMTEDAPSIGDSAYEALQVMAQKRFHSGSVLTLAYTLSHMVGTADVLSPWLENNRFGVGGSIGVQDNNHIKPDKATGYPGEQSISSFDTPHRLVTNFVYALPFGHGQRFGAGASGLVNGLIGNWEVNGISTFQSGFPIAFEDNNPNQLQNLYAQGNAGPGTGAGVTRPNYSPTNTGCNAHPAVGGKPSARLKSWFNTACYTVPGQWAFGNEPRVDPNLRSQGIDSTDFSVSKAFPIHDRYRVDFRMESFNLFNWTQFSAPNDQADTTIFGQVTSTANNPRLIQLSGRFSF